MRGRRVRGTEPEIDDLNIIYVALFLLSEMCSVVLTSATTKQIAMAKRRINLTFVIHSS